MPLSTLLPRHRVNLLAGVRDSGKTRFIIPAMLAWQPQPPPWAYVASDRSILDAQDTIKDMQYPLSDVPLVAAYGWNHMASWTNVVQALAKLSPLPEIIVVEAFQDFAESINKRNLVHEFMNHVDATCHPSKEFPKGFTVIGITGSPKQSMRDRYPDPTQRVPGTSIWVERASAVIVIESSNDETLSLTTVARKLHWCRKHGGIRLEVDGAFDQFGRLQFPAL